ncbi:MAG TPA: response regulator transcription factor [Candidatus Paceibacterota bacterium]|nr:response regulator transcription factor [Candidatus Paceibacterota bacterium]
MRIIVVEDEPRLARALRQGLQKHGFAVDLKSDGKEALDHVLIHHSVYDLVILDLMLPNMEGLQICKAVRDHEINVPILVLTAKNQTQDKVEALNAGADDYMTKPFSLNELVARINARLRRTEHAYPTKLQAQDITLDVGQHKVYRGDKEIVLTVKEFALLEFFMRNVNQVLNREYILDHIWDFDFNSFSNVVDVHVKNLRKKLGKTKTNEDYIQTVSGVGYRFKA